MSVLMTRRKKKNYVQVLCIILELLPSDPGLEEVGLKGAYSENNGVHQYMRLLIGLPILPAEHKEETFLHLARKSSSPLQPLVKLVRDT